MKTKLLFTLSLIFTMLCCSSSLSAQWIPMDEPVGGEYNYRLGRSVSMSDDGHTIAAGAPGKDGGYARVYDWNGNKWLQRGQDIPGEANGDRSGTAVSISGDGNTIVIGAPLNSVSAYRTGHVRVYGWNGIAWVKKGQDIDGESVQDETGSALDVSNNGNTLIIGCARHDTAGYVRIYDWNGTAWLQRGQDINGESAGDASGCSVSMNGDGSIVAIGATGNDGNGTVAGHVRIYRWNGTAWLQQGQDIDGESAGDRSGYSVSISDNGNTLAIGAPDNDGTSGYYYNDQGHVRIYDWNGTAWLQRGQDIELGIGSDFGKIISLSGDGNTVIISKVDYKTFVYVWEGGWIEKGTLLPISSLEEFGWSISTNNDGNKVAVGASDFNLNGIGNSGYVRVFEQKDLYSCAYQDLNQNCIKELIEFNSLIKKKLVINPGNIIVEANNAGFWSLDSLPAGNYTITVDTSGNWQPTCPTTQSFTVVHPDSITVAPSFGFISTAPCPTPAISIQAPFLRPGFSNQRVHVQACNQAIGTALLDSAYVVVELDSLLTVQSSSMSYTSLGNNQYEVYVGDLSPNQCVNFYFDCIVSLNAVLGQSLCMQADLYPVDSCSLDTVPQYNTSCNTAYDESSLAIKAVCKNDSICFIIRNIADGNMSCYSAVRLYIDGQYLLLDSIQLLSGQDTTFKFAGDGRTWRMEVDQHPLHPGNSQPSATIERCGNKDNWTPDLFNILPQDDADPVRDIFCGIVTGSYDPNDKRGFPLGITNNHNINQNQELDYTIRFQNTGTDTAFTVVIRDTLPMELDIFSVRSGAASHNYEFRMYGPRVLEWTFPYIYLVDSTTNEPESHGFVSFKVRQNKDLPIGTTIENNAGIYFDFNAPIITNRTLHTIGLPQDLTWDGLATINSTICAPYTFNGITYNQAGTYFNTVQNGVLDSLYTLNLSEVDATVVQTGINLSANATGATYQWIDCQTNQLIVGETAANYTAVANGNYAVEITKNGCVDTSACYSITVVGVEDIENAAWQLYPNPTKGNFKVALDQVYSTVQLRVTDVQGRVVAVQEYAGQQYLEVELEQVSGLYFVQVYTNEKVAVFKVLKK